MVVETLRIVLATDNKRKVAAGESEYGEIVADSIGPERVSGIPESDGEAVIVSQEKPEKILSHLKDGETALATDNQTIVGGVELLRPDRDVRLAVEHPEHQSALVELFVTTCNLYNQIGDRLNEIVFRASWTLRSKDGSIKKTMGFEIFALIGAVNVNEIFKAFQFEDGEMPECVRCGPILDIATIISQAREKLVKVLAIRNIYEENEEWRPLSNFCLAEKLIRQCVLPKEWLTYLVSATDESLDERGYMRVKLPLQEQKILGEEKHE